MMNGLVVKRGEVFLARKGPKSAALDAYGNRWSKELQAARVFADIDIACGAAKRVGGIVRRMRDGKLVEE